MILTVYTLNVLLRKMMHFICIFVIPFISDSYFILREYNGEFLPWLGARPVRIKLKTRKINGQSSLDNQLNTTNMSHIIRLHYFVMNNRANLNARHRHCITERT